MDIATGASRTRGVRSALRVPRAAMRRLDVRLARRSRRCPEAGVALVEFSLVLGVLVLLLFAMLDFGKAFNYWIDETHLANKGARFAAVNKNPGSGPALQDWIKQGANTTELRDAISVCIDFPNGSSNVGDPVRVRVTSSYTWMPLLDALPNPELTGTATMRLEAKPTNYSAGCST